MLFKKIVLIWFIPLAMLFPNATAHCQSQSQFALIQRPVFENPLISKLTRNETNTLWGVDLFGNSPSAAQSYIMTPGYELWSATSFHLDNIWNRMLFQECLANWIFAFGEPGSGIGQFLWPSRLDAHAPCGYDGYDTLYHIFVADAANDRIVKLSWDWVDWEMAWLGTITGGGLDQPEDLDINNGGTFFPTSDDYLWVLNGHEIKRFTVGGTLMHTYGSYECDPEGVGNFCRPTAVVCGRSPSGDELYSNNNYIYVADDGNQRLVWLSKHPYFEFITWQKSLSLPLDARIVDLEADIFGQIWAVDKDNGRIYKYTYDVYPLCYYGSFGTGENQFYYPLSFSNTAGYLGCGNVYVAESWTDNSGGQYFVIGTDVLDFEVNSSVDYRWHYINYTLVDPSDVTIEIYDAQDQLVDTLFDAMEYSGVCTHVWDGTDQSGQPVGTGAYRVVVTDSCNYGDPETGGRVNGVVKEAWLHHKYDPDLFTPWISGSQTGPDEITLRWMLPIPPPDHWFTIYCDGCLCGAAEPRSVTYTDKGLIPDRNYVYWVKAYEQCSESDPSNAVTVFLGSKALFPSVSNIIPADKSFIGPTSWSEKQDTCDVAIFYATTYPGYFKEIWVMLKNPVAICGFNFLIKLRNDPNSDPNLIDFHTNRISTDSILIGSNWTHYPVRECWIDTSGSLISGFSSVSSRGQVADTTLTHCKYLWVQAWAPPDDYIPPNPSQYQLLFKFGVDAHCIPDSTTHRNVRFDLAFDRLYGRQYEEIPFVYHQGDLTIWISVPGDASGDSLVDLGDILFLQSYLYQGGPEPCIPEAGDPKSISCMVDLTTSFIEL